MRGQGPRTHKIASSSRHRDFRVVWSALVIRYHEGCPELSGPRSSVARPGQRRSWHAGVLGLVSVLAYLVGAAPAGAINRVNCGSQFDQLFANSGNATTCWANPGGVSVTLYHVVGQSAGNNAGCYNGINYQNNGTNFPATVLFYKYYNYSFVGSFNETIQYVYHNPAGTQSWYCTT